MFKNQGPARRHSFFTVEGHGAVAAVARLDFNGCLIHEHKGIRLLSGRPVLSLPGTARLIEKLPGETGSPGSFVFFLTAPRCRR